MAQELVSIKPLRKCRICGWEAYSNQELENFHKDTRLSYGRENVCKTCLNKMNRKGGKYWPLIERAGKKKGPYYMKFQGKNIRLSTSPRKNVCSRCSKRYPDDLRERTILHHTIYNPKNPLDYTIELCHSCHVKTHGFGIVIRPTRSKQEGLLNE